MFLSSATGQPRHSLEVYEGNLRAIFTKLQELTDAKIIFALTTPVIESRQAASEGYKRVVRREADVVRYNARAAQIAKETGIEVNDVHGLSIRVGTDDVLRESDGIHLSKVGEEVIGKHVANVIADALRDSTEVDGKPKEGFTAIFNGTDLAGWDGKPGAWEVHDGEIWCTGKAEQKNWLIWRGQQPSDFVLRLEFRWDKGNSGVQVRSDDLGNWMVHGYQVEVAKQSVMGLWHHSLLAADHPRKQARHLMATAGQKVILASDGSKIVKQVDNPDSLKRRFNEHAWNTLEIVKQYGGKAVQCKSGHAFIKQVMREVDAVYGGEMSAHHYFRDFAYCDSGMIPWLVLGQLLSETGKPLSALVGERMRLFPASGEINRKLLDQKAAIEAVKARYVPKALKVESVDGLSVEFEQWRFNLRSSNTEPLVRLNVESRGDAALMNDKTAEILALLQQYA